MSALRRKVPPRVVTLSGLVAISVFVNSALAQSKQGSIDVGGVALRYADTLNASAGTLSPEFRLDWPGVTVAGTGTFSQFRTGAWSTEGELSTSLFTPRLKAVVGELSGTLGGSAHRDLTRTGESIANVRLHFMGPNLGLFAGVGGGATWDGFGWGKLVQGEAGAWVRYESGVAQLTVTPVSINDSIRYTDAQLSLSWRSGPLDVSALAGVRMGTVLPAIGSSAKTWGSLTAVLWLTPQVGIAAGGGAYPVDLTQGFPGGRFASIALRLSSLPRSFHSTTQNDSTEVQTAPGAPALAPGLASFGVERRPGGLVTLSARASGARTVEVSGDFTGWVPLPLQHSADDLWTTTLQIKPGKYQMNVRVDGGKWLVPPGLLLLSDEFGGTVGLIVIE
jgi:Glycogen recognition site of AMP-activated protein kinase